MSQNIFLEKYYHKNKKKSPIKIVIDILFSLTVIYAICCILFNNIFLRVQVVGRSMQPTFNVALGLEENEEKSTIKDIVYINRFQNDYDKSDIVLIKKEDITIIKRVIAVSGDVVELKRGDDGFYHFFVNGEKSDESFIKDVSEMNQNYFNEFALVDGVEIVNQSALLTVSEGKVFVLGDNRGNSEDSHLTGCFEAKNVVGKVCFWHSYNENIYSFLWRKFIEIF